MATDTVVQQPTKTDRRLKLAPEQRAEMLRLIQDEPELTDLQVARRVGVSAALVWKARNKAERREPETDVDIDTANAELERLIGERLPPRTLVRALERLISNPKTPASVRLAAINTAAELRGIVTRKQRKDAEANRVPAVGIFVLPAGSAPAASLDLPAVVVQPALEQPAVTSASPDTDKPTS
jgi:hypothetical protein